MANLLDIVVFLVVVSLADGQITPPMLVFVGLYTAVRIAFMIRKRRREK